MADNDWQARLKTGRNDPCPCGSGKKYKKCHLEADEAAQSAALAKTNAAAAEEAKKHAEEHDHDHSAHDHPHEHGHKHDHAHGPRMGGPTNVQKQVSAPRKVGSS